MISLCSDISAFFHKECKNELQKVIQAGLDDQKKINSLNMQIIGFINRIQELKAINDFQTADLERKVTELEKELAILAGSKLRKDNDA